MVRPSVPDPPEIADRLWEGFHGTVGWDVGANCGQSLIEMNWLFDRIEAFEPCPESCREAAATAHRFLPGKPVRVWQQALSDKDGEIELAFPAREQKETGQLVTIGTAGMEWEPDDWDAVEKVTVPCRTADSMAAELGWPDFMKVDTEGHEVAVLRGAPQLLARGLTDLLIEFHTPGNHAACEEILMEAGYFAVLVRHPHYPPESAMWQQHGWLRAFAPERRKA